MSPTLIELKPLAPAHGGTCIAHTKEGKPVFVAHTAAGETVRAVIHTQRSKVAYADAVEVLDPHPARRAHIWPQAGPGGVGGAELGHLEESFQRQWKEQVIYDQLRRVGGKELYQHVQAQLGTGGARVRAASGDEGEVALHRRLRIECEVSARGRLAMRPAHGRELIDIEDMPLADESLLQLQVWGDTPWSKKWKPGQRVRLLAPQKGQARIVVGKKVYDPDGKEVAPFVTWQVQHAGQQVGLTVHAQGFWQSHRSAANDLVETVMRLSRLQPGDSVLELYAGAGLLSFFMAEQIGPTGRLLTVEGAAQAVADARSNLASLGTGVRIWRGNVDACTVKRAGRQFGGSPTAVVLDPPRAGAGREVIAAIAELKAQRVVLVSCDPAAGARDCAALLESGYALGGIEAIDLFPQTHHVEIVSVWELP